MENSLLVALSHQAVLRRSLDVVANNLANMTTTGFKAQRPVFEDHLVPTRGDSPLRQSIAFVRDGAIVRDPSDGSFETTANPLDVAIQGDGFFAISTPTGEQYTRAGHFHLDPAGRLVNELSHPVLNGTNGPILIGPADSRITIAADGSIASENGPLGQLKIVRFDRPEALRAVAGGAYAADEAPQPATEARVQQGALESSNVEPITEIARMMSIHRAYDQTRALIEKEDGRIRAMIDAYAA